MKSFEERFAAWVDDRLAEDDLPAFRREMEARPDIEALRSEKAAAGRLRTVLRENLSAPALANAEFFVQEIRRRIEAEQSERDPAPVSWFGRLWKGPEGPAFWTPGRLLAAGTACLLLAAVGFLTLIPHGGSGSNVYGIRQAASARGTEPGMHGDQQAPSGLSADTQAPAEEPGNIVSNSPAPETEQKVAVVKGGDRPAMLAKKEDHPDPDLSAILNARVQTPGASATAIHFADQNADVLWLNGLDYVPEVNAPGAPAGASPPASPGDGAPIQR